MNAEYVKPGMLVLINTENPTVKQLARVKGVNKARVLLEHAFGDTTTSIMGISPVADLTPLPDDPYYVYLTSNADIKALRGHGWWVDQGPGYKLGVFDGTYQMRVSNATMRDRTLLAGPHGDLWWLWNRARTLGVPLNAPEPARWWDGGITDGIFNTAEDHSPEPEPPENMRIYTGPSSWTERDIMGLLTNLLTDHVKSLVVGSCVGCEPYGFHITDPATGNVFLVNVHQDY
jgi:hypothetical protein